MARRSRAARAAGPDDQHVDQHDEQAGGLALDTADDAPLTGPHDGDDLDPEITDAAGTVDFGSIRVPVPATGTVTVEPTAKGRMQAVHIALPEGRLSVSALAAPKSSKLWPELAREIDKSLRDGGARVRSFTGHWGRELHATSGGATSVFIGVDGPRWMLYGVATGPTADAEALDGELRRVLRGTVVMRGKSPYPVRTILPLTVPDHLSAGTAAADGSDADASAATKAAPRSGDRARRKPAAARSGPGKAAPAGRTGATTAATDAAAAKVAARRAAARKAAAAAAVRAAAAALAEQAAADRAAEAEETERRTPAPGTTDTGAREAARTARTGAHPAAGTIPTGPGPDAPLREQAPSARRAAAASWRSRPTAPDSALDDDLGAPPTEALPLTGPDRSAPPPPTAALPRVEPGSGGRRRRHEPDPLADAPRGRRHLLDGDPLGTAPPAPHVERDSEDGRWQPGGDPLQAPWDGGAGATGRQRWSDADPLGTADPLTAPWATPSDGTGWQRRSRDGFPDPADPLRVARSGDLGDDLGDDLGGGRRWPDGDPLGMPDPLADPLGGRPRGLDGDPGPGQAYWGGDRRGPGLDPVDPLSTSAVPLHAPRDGGPDAGGRRWPGGAEDPLTASADPGPASWDGGFGGGHRGPGGDGPPGAAVDPVQAPWNSGTGAGDRPDPHAGSGVPGRASWDGGPGDPLGSADPLRASWESAPTAGDARRFDEPSGGPRSPRSDAAPGGRRRLREPDVDLPAGAHPYPGPPAGPGTTGGRRRLHEPAATTGAWELGGESDASGPLDLPEPSARGGRRRLIEPAADEPGSRRSGRGAPSGPPGRSRTGATWPEEPGSFRTGAAGDPVPPSAGAGDRWGTGPGTDLPGGRSGADPWDARPGIAGTGGRRPVDPRNEPGPLPTTAGRGSGSWGTRPDAPTAYDERRPAGVSATGRRRLGDWRDDPAGPVPEEPAAEPGPRGRRHLVDPAPPPGPATEPWTGSTGVTGTGGRRRLREPGAVDGAGIAGTGGRRYLRDGASPSVEDTGGRRHRSAPVTRHAPATEPWLRDPEPQSGRRRLGVEYLVETGEQAPGWADDLGGSPEPRRSRRDGGARADDPVPPPPPTAPLRTHPGDRPRHSGRHSRGD